MVVTGELPCCSVTVIFAIPRPFAVSWHELPSDSVIEAAEKQRVVKLVVLPDDVWLSPSVPYLRHEPVPSPTLVPRPNDWSDEITITGYWFAPRDPAFVPDPTLVEFLAAGDAYAFASMTETFGLACVEAAICGLPIVASNLDVMREVLTAEENIGRVLQRSVDQLVDSVPGAWSLYW